MRLHFRGITVPALGSTRDIVYRDFMFHENKVEVKKAEIAILSAVSASVHLSSDKAAEWNKYCETVLKDYVSLLLGHKIDTVARRDSEMLDYYQKYIKDTSPVIFMKDEVPYVSHLPDLPDFKKD